MKLFYSVRFNKAIPYMHLMLHVTDIKPKLGTIKRQQWVGASVRRWFIDISNDWFNDISSNRLYRFYLFIFFFFLAKNHGDSNTEYISLNLFKK